MELQTLKHELLEAVAAAADLAALEQVRVAALGKQGSVSALLKTLGGMSAEERQEKGPSIHALREQVTSALAARRAELEERLLEARLASERVDLTLPAPEAPKGTVHPVS
jgi:phenylalanyl-tRNA synthetase alpha chain